MVELPNLIHGMHDTLSTMAQARRTRWPEGHSTRGGCLSAMISGRLDHRLGWPARRDVIFAPSSRPERSWEAVIKRCAIYTRKSVIDPIERGLSTLDAQRQLCESFVASQAGEGWVAPAEAEPSRLFGDWHHDAEGQAV